MDCVSAHRRENQGQRRKAGERAPAGEQRAPGSPSRCRLEVRASVGEDPAAQSARRLVQRDALRQELRRGLEPAQLGAAFDAARRQMALERGRLLGVEGAEQIGGDLVATALVGGAHTSPSASSLRIFSRPRRILPLTVPSGSPSISAISEWLKPPK